MVGNAGKDNTNGWNVASINVPTIHLALSFVPMSKAKLPKVMAAGDVAKLLNVSYQYIDKLVKQGRLPCQQTSSGMIFLEADVLRFKKERERKAKQDRRIKQ